MDKTGVIYILTNPSFPEYVKIGYADDIDKRLQQLNRSECIPFAFRVYATYEVNSRLSDLKIHPLFNPSLVIDYQTKILLTRPDRELHSIVISSLADKLASIYDSHDIKTDYTIRKPLLLDNKQCPFLPIMDTTQKALQSIHTWLSTKCFRRITNMYSSR